MTVLQLARPDVAALRPYVTAEQRPDTVRLNANEAPSDAGHSASGLNRYPPIYPQTLATRLAELYGVSRRNLLVTRGSSEAIDLLIRSFCRAYTDDIVTTSPSFSMYRVYAEMQAAGVVDIPLRNGSDFTLDAESVLSACTECSKIIFLCSPNNPSGDLLDRDSVFRIIRGRAGRSLVVVDEAYIEFSSSRSLVDAINDFDNLVILRTLSKAYGLAGARCGSIIAQEPVIRLLGAMLPPYAFSSPTIDSVLAALTTESVDANRQLVSATIRERERMRLALSKLDAVTHIWPSQSNFLLVRFSDLQRITQALLQARVLIRSFVGDPVLENCARITIGDPEENNLLLETIRQSVEAGS